MKLSTAFSILAHFRLALWTAFMPTLSAIWKTPSLLWLPHQLWCVLMAHALVTLFGNGIDEGRRPIKQTLLPENAYGVVLDIGAGHGHTVLYLDRLKIRTRAARKGFTEAAGTLLMLPYPAKETSFIVSALGDARKVDTLISMLTLC